MGNGTLPAGFMEMGETTQEAAVRETVEEAGARVEIGAIQCYANVPRISQVYVIFLAKLLDLNFAPGLESLEVALLGEHEIPWDELAFPVVERALRFYLDDRRSGAFQTRVIDIYHRPTRQPA